jgi:hypothetical protein
MRYLPAQAHIGFLFSCNFYHKSLIMKHLVLILVFLGSILMQNCKPKNETTTAATANATPTVQAAALPNTPAAGFPEYWYQGKAELSTYDVVQERYGETRQAEQVNIFVTEDFSRNKQVKLDDAAAAGADRVPVLKLNAVRRFKTGIYDYSIMSSVFSPIDGSPALKSTCSVQDWCGQVFIQTNLEANGSYRARSFSYFEAESDEDKKIGPALLEDELWTRIRLNPASLPTGKKQVVPSAVFSRIRHKAYIAHPADIQVVKGDKESTLRLNYEGLPRALSIVFETASPHRILSWEEMDNAKVSSKGTLKKTRMSAYWSENSNGFASLRDSLQITLMR